MSSLILENGYYLSGNLFFDRHIEFKLVLKMMMRRPFKTIKNIIES